MTGGGGSEVGGQVCGWTCQRHRQKSQTRLRHSLSFREHAAFAHVGRKRTHGGESRIRLPDCRAWLDLPASFTQVRTHLWVVQKCAVLASFAKDDLLNNCKMGLGVNRGEGASRVRCMHLHGLCQQACHSASPAKAARARRMEQLQAGCSALVFIPAPSNVLQCLVILISETLLRCFCVQRCSQALGCWVCRHACTRARG